MNGLKNTYVLAGDFGYIFQLETTLKSIAYHNRNIKVYIFNDNIPQEWFINMRKKLALLGSELVDVKLSRADLAKYEISQKHINYMSYARLFIPRFVAEDTVLYLDCDTIVDQNLTKLFTLDFEENLLIGVHDDGGDETNTGVMLLNNKQCKYENVTDKLLTYALENSTQINNGDQTVINEVLQGRIKHISAKYNYQIGFDTAASANGSSLPLYTTADKDAAIIHYLTESKPWSPYVTRLRERWWYYNNMSWDEIITKWSKVVAPTKKDVLIVIPSQEIMGLEKLAQALPQVTFHLAAFTKVSDQIMALTRFENIRVYPSIIKPIFEHLLYQSDFFLDISLYNTYLDRLQQMLATGKEVLAFEESKDPRINAANYQVCDFNEMVARLAE